MKSFLFFGSLCCCCLRQETEAFVVNWRGWKSGQAIGSCMEKKSNLDRRKIPNEFLMSDEGSTRKIWRIERPGNLKQLKQIGDMLPPPSPGEITVRVESIGLNFADVFTVLGMYDAAPRDKPVIPGLEFCGIVEAVGDRKGIPRAKIARSQDGSRCAAHPKSWPWLRRGSNEQMFSQS